MTKNRNFRPSGKQWSAVGSAAITMGYVAGPVGAAATAIGATAGCVAANWLAWKPEEHSDSSGDLTPS